MFALAFFEKYLIYSVETQNGRTDYYYYDEITWVVAFLFVSWLIWFFVRHAIRARKFVRKSKTKKDRSFKKIIKAKEDLSRRYLKKGFSENIHAVGIGKVPASEEHCLQIFINDTSTRIEDLPNEYKGIPIILVQIPTASFLGFVVEIEQERGERLSISEVAKPIRGRQEKIVGGISGANANLKGQSGTIGYFCRKKSIIPRKSDTYLLSNTHVFADLKNPQTDETDLIVQPSPGEPAKSHPIGELTNYSTIKLENTVDSPNKIDAAIAKLWKTQTSQNLIPMIGKIKGFAKKDDIEVGEFARKFGRTTGFTAGNIFSTYLDIWIKYDRTGQKAYFKDQILVEPNSDFEKFVEKGDSGSLLVDGENYASGLIFAGANGKLKDFKTENGKKIDIRIDNFGVANSISDVLIEMRLEFI